MAQDVRGGSAIPEPDGSGSVIKMIRPGGSLDRARLLVENLLRSHGLDPTRHLLSEGDDSCSWLFWAGGPPASEAGEAGKTLLVMSVFLARGSCYFRVSSPIVFLPEGDRQKDFYRRLLDLNSEMVSSALATVGSEVHVVSVRPVQDLDGSEVEDIIRSVSGYANMLREQLHREFEVRKWVLAESTGREAEEEGGDDLLD